MWHIAMQELPSRLKRQRVCNASSGQSSGRAWREQQAAPCAASEPHCGGAAATESTPTDAVAKPCMPWHASQLLDYVHRCLEGLSHMHPACGFIQTDTKAAEMACAIFRQVRGAQPTSGSRWR